MQRCLHYFKGSFKNRISLNSIIGSKTNVEREVNLQRLTVTTKAMSKAGWVIFFMWLIFKQVIYGQELNFEKNTSFCFQI